MEFEIQSSANQESRIVSTRSTSYSLLEIRLVFSSLIFLFLSFYWLIWAGIAGALVQASLYYWFLWKQQEKGLDWEKMVHVEEHRLHQIYQFINLFTDVPEITAKIKRRRYLDPILTHIKRESKNTYLYLFARRLARGSDLVVFISD